MEIQCSSGGEESSKPLTKRRDLRDEGRIKSPMLGKPVSDSTNTDSVQKTASCDMTLAQLEDQAPLAKYNDSRASSATRILEQ